jgi:ceroid-lipofuscinosis protein 8
MKSKTQLSSILVLTHLGFFFFEWSAQIYFDYRFKVLSKALHVHHLICIVGYICSAITQLNYYFACSGFILEMTTPFSCICYVLIKCKLENTIAWKANQMLLIHLFHMRTVIEFSMIYEYIKYFEHFKVLPFIYHVQISKKFLIV